MIPWPAWREWVFSLKAYIAMALALYIAFSIDLPRPYWAMATVYIVAQPLSGMVQSKAVYRVLGTIGGASFAIFALPTFVDSPELLTLVLSLWTGLCLYLSLMDKTPRAYAFMLAGYTAAFIAFPSVSTPDQIFDIGLARAEEIILAILCVTVVDMVILPQRVGPLLQKRLDLWFQDAASGITMVLRPERYDEKAMAEMRHKLVLDATAIEQLRVHAAYDTPRLRRAQPWLYELQQRMQSLFAIITSIEDRLGQVRRHQPENARELEGALDEIGLWLSDPDPKRVEHLHAMLHSFEPSSRAIRETLDDLLLANAIARLHDLVDLWAQCQELRARVVKGTPAIRSAGPAAVYRDHAMGALSGLAAALAIAICCAFWIATGWPDGASAPMMAAVLCSFFATQDDPSPLIAAFLKTIVLAVVVAGIYLFWVFPAIDGYVMLIASLAPFTIIAGGFIAIPQTMLYGLGLVVNAAASMGLQEAYSADLPNFVNSSIALILGSATAFVVTRLVRTVGSDFMVRRLVRAIQQDLADVAIGRLAVSDVQLEGRMFDRINALIPRLRGATEMDRVAVLRGALADFRLSYNLFVLRRLRKNLGPAARNELASFLRALPPFFKQRLQARAKPDLALLLRLDHVIQVVAAEPVDKATTAMLLALIGARRSLFPDCSLTSPPADDVRPPTSRNAHVAAQAAGATA